MSGIKPTGMSKTELLQVLDDIRYHVQVDDSFEGFLNYLIPDQDDLSDTVEFMVEARYRIGNSAGQGGMRIFGETPTANAYG